MEGAIPPPPHRVALIGAGRVGTAVAELMRRSNHLIVGVASATASSTSAGANRLHAPVFDLGAELPGCDLVLIGTPDGAIEAVARHLARRIRPGIVVVHFSGSAGVGPLESVTRAGAFACALHPVQACPDVDTAITRLPGSAWGVTCPVELRDWAVTLVAEDLGGLPVVVDEADRPLWHAAAVATSNGIAALMATGELILTSIGVERPERVLVPLAAGTVSNARARGGGAATLTGPVVRGEVSTIVRHLDHLRTHAPDLAGTYALITRTILSTAHRTKRVGDATLREVSEVLDGR
jgi:predicted short-subunit dehydrogenase-like oxidoreductase (DUF2520 family)